MTIPHKLAALEFAEKPDVQSDLVGASNTLFQKDGAWHCTNTDYDAIVDTVEEALNGEDGRRGELKDARVLILGAGGVARAAVAGMINKGAIVTICNRTAAKAKTLAEEFGCLSTVWANRGAEQCDVLINCTAVGMHPNVNDSPYEQHWLHERMLVFDTVYTPENTLLLKHARMRGCATATGVEMFVRQGAKQFQIFTGQEPPVDYMIETLRQARRQAAVG